MTKTSNKLTILFISVFLALSFHSACFADETSKHRLDPYALQIEKTIKETWKSPNGLNPINVISVPMSINNDGNVHVMEAPWSVEGPLESKQSKEIVSTVERLKFPPPPADSQAYYVLTYLPGLNIVKVLGSDYYDSRPTDPERVQKLQDLEDTLNATADTLDRMGAAVSLYDMFKEKFLQVVFFIIVPVIAIYALVRKIQKKEILPK